MTYECFVLNGSWLVYVGLFNILCMLVNFMMFSYLLSTYSA